MPPLLQSALAGARGEARQIGRHLVLAVVVALVAAMGLAMLVVAAFLCLAQAMTAPAAAAVTGGGLLAAAGLMALAAWLAKGGGVRRPASGPAPREPCGAEAVGEILNAAMTAIESDARSKTPRLALVALLAGCAIGASPRLQRVLADLVR